MKIKKNPIKKNSVINILILLLTILIVFLVFEIHLNVQYTTEHNKLISKYPRRELCTMSSENKDLIYTAIPNKCGFNSKGYADYEHNISKKNKILNNQLTGYSIVDFSSKSILTNEVGGVFRIVVIGDSVAAGLGVKSQENFAKVLERKLNNLGNNKFEVIVLAISGYSTSQELVLLQEEAFDYGPNLIIWSYTLNDPADPIYHDANGELGRYYFKPDLHVLHYLSKKLFFINEKRKAKNCEKEYHKFLHCVYWDDVKSNIKKIGQISSKRDIPIIFLIHPIFEENNYINYSLSELHQNLSREALKNNLIVLDILDEYKNYNVSEIKQNREGWYDPWHPNEKGHKIIADFLYNKLIQKKYAKK